MVDSLAFLAERLSSEGERAISFFQSITPHQWDQTVYTDGARWTLRQVLAHFVATENSLLRLVENIAAGGPGSPENFDLNRFNERKVTEYGEFTVEELIEKFKENRKKTIVVVTTLTLQDLSLRGRHPFLGVVPLEEIIKIIYRHNQIHQREIRKVLSEVK